MFHAMIEKLVEPAAEPGAAGGRRALRLALPIGAAVLLLLIVVVLAFDWASRHAASQTGLRAAEDAKIQAGLLASELQKFQLLPVVLPEYPDVAAALEHPTPALIQRLNGKLELVAGRTDAAAIYLIDAQGTTIAASNWRRPDSFVGQRYGFRPYFTGALRDGSAQLFALGTVSGRPGLYIARRVSEGGRALGVIVVKVEFDRIEAEWRRQGGVVIVTDPHGVVLITSRPDWRFRTRTPLDPDTRAAARRSRQYGGAPVRPLDLPRDADGSFRIDGDGYGSGSAAVPLLDSQLTSFQPSAPDRAAANATARTIALSAFIAIALLCAIVIRARERRLMQMAARAALEAEVALRTADLREANAMLREESRERELADLRYRRSREELAQANRLGSLGQITAGVAHEINQPVAAIRTFAENAGTFLDRGKPEQVRGNLGTIVEMADRIGTITAELRKFARRGTPEIGRVAVSDVIDGTMLLVGDRIRGEGVSFERIDDAPGIHVVADRVRLEQILVNLIQNALQALEGRDQPAIRLDVTSGEDVRLTVADNGAGVDPLLAPEIFTPFVTGRHDGLGLGLGIARDIAREFGGDLSLVPSPLGGAAFQLRLKRA